MSVTCLDHTMRMMRGKNTSYDLHAFIREDLSFWMLHLLWHVILRSLPSFKRNFVFASSSFRVCFHEDDKEIQN